MSRRPILASPVLAVLALAAASAQSQQADRSREPETGRFGNPTSIARKYQSYIYGVIKKIGKEDLVLEKTKFGVDTTVKVNAKTKYLRDQKPSTLETLQVGDQVYVDVKTDKKSGEMTAKKVVSGVLPTS
jgi:hypothetical protein